MTKIEEKLSRQFDISSKRLEIRSVPFFSVRLWITLGNWPERARADLREREIANPTTIGGHDLDHRDS